MGGGRDNRRTLGDTRDLEEKIRREFERSERVRRNVFISFSSDDIDEVNLLRAHAKNEKSEIEFIDRSVLKPFDSERDEYLRQKITERIRQASLTIVYLSDSAADSGWVNWEIERSIELGKEVIGTYKGDSPPVRLPDVFAKYDIEVVSWSDLGDRL